MFFRQKDALYRQIIVEAVRETAYHHYLRLNRAIRSAIFHFLRENNKVMRQILAW